MAKSKYLVLEIDPTVNAPSNQPKLLDPTRSRAIVQVIVTQLPEAAAFDPATGDALLRIIVGKSNTSLRVTDIGWSWSSTLDRNQQPVAEDEGIYYYWRDGVGLTADKVEIVCVPAAVEG